MRLDSGYASFPTPPLAPKSGTLSHVSELFGGLVEQLGSDEFHQTLRSALFELTGFDSCIILDFRDSGAPTVLEHCSSIQPDRFQLCYMKQAYRLDPFYRAAVEKKSIGVSRYRELSGPDFTRSDYFNTYYKDVPLVDEIGILCPIGDGHTVHISLGRCKGSVLFDRTVLARLNSIEPLIASLVRRHATLRTALGKPIEAPGTGPAAEASWLRDFNATRREMEVASLVLRGHTNPSIGMILGVSEHTVKVHRKRLYGKLSISSQAELFMMFMQKKRQN